MINKFIIYRLNSKTTLNMQYFCNILVVIFTLIFLSCTLENENVDSKSEETVVNTIVTTIEEKPVNQILPKMVDNSTSKYFRGIVTQLKSSCAQTSSVAYIYTYEINLLRNLDSTILNNKYPSHWTYNFANDGTVSATSIRDAEKIIKDAGVPTAEYYGNELGYNEKRWVSGYEIYYKAMFNRIDDIENISLTDIAGLEKVKGYLYNHNGTSTIGGLVKATIGTVFERAILPKESSDSGKKIEVKFLTKVNHAITIVGYDDDIKYDYNDDGVFTNDIDINNDGVVDIKDYEIGAFKIAESHGINNGWTDKGYYYISYKMFAEKCEVGGAGYDYVSIIKPIINYKPKMTFRIKINHASRNQIKIFSGISTDVNAIKPDKDKIKEYYHLKYCGGNLPIAGDSEDSIEIGIDLTELYNRYNKTGETAFFLGVNSRGRTGLIEECELIDYENNLNFKSDSSMNIITGDNYIKILYKK